MKITDVQIMEVTAKPRKFNPENTKTIDGLLSPAYIYSEYKEKVTKAGGNLFFSGDRQ